MVLVTGATGILGRVIVLELLKRGQTVRATKRKSSNILEVKDSYRFYTENASEYFDKIEWIDVDFNDLFSLETALQDITEVYHCAATVSFNPDMQSTMFRTNIDGTKNLLIACEGSSVKKFCFISSTAVLDGLNDKGELDEDSDYNLKTDHSAYAISKHLSEMEVWRASAEGLNTVIVNPGIIIGSGNWHESSGQIFKNFSRGFTFSGGTSYIDVRDVAKASVELMEKNAFGERYILISDNKRYPEVGTLVRQKIGKSAPKIIAPSLITAGRIANFFLGWLLPPLRMINRVNAQSVSSFTTISNRKITEKLDFKFIPIEESIDFHLTNYLSELKK